MQQSTNANVEERFGRAIEARRAATVDRERGRIEERLLSNLIALVKLRPGDPRSRTADRTAGGGGGSY